MIWVTAFRSAASSPVIGGRTAARLRPDEPPLPAHGLTRPAAPVQLAAATHELDLMISSGVIVSGACGAVPSSKEPASAIARSPSVVKCWSTVVSGGE